MSDRRLFAIIGVIIIAVLGLTLWFAVGITHYVSDGGLARDLGQNVKEFEKAKN